MYTMNLSSSLMNVMKRSATCIRFTGPMRCPCRNEIIVKSSFQVFSSEGGPGKSNPSFNIGQKNDQVESRSNKTDTVHGDIENSNADIFGTLNKLKFSGRNKEDEEDLLEKNILENVPITQRRLHTKQYADIIKRYIKEKKMKDAVDVLEVRMIQQDRVQPEPYIYSLLISACGRLGFSRKAFQLYNRMKKRGLKVHGSIYTSLFNACANSPWAQDGLKRATHLRELMAEKGIEPNATHYHAMIKAFGHCGDLATAFSVVDEMNEKQYQLTEETFNFLLQASIADKEAGFRHALLVWRKLLQRRIIPTVYTFNLILRSVRDCGLGSPEAVQSLLNEIFGGEDKVLQLTEGRKLLQQDKDDGEDMKAFEGDVNAYSSIIENTNEAQEVKGKTLSTVENRPNLLAPQPHLGNIISVGEIATPQDRLFLIGGISGFLKQMEDMRVAPDIKTFTLLLDSIPSTISAENKLLSEMKRNGIDSDIDFFNMLIKKRSMRFDYSSARAVLQLVQRANLHPDIVTFGVLALGCKTADEAQQLIADMTNSGYRMNAEILGAMLHQACAQHNFDYALKIMRIAKQEEVQPNARFLAHLKQLNSSCWQLLRDKDNNLQVPEFVRDESFEQSFRAFSGRYKGWLRSVQPEEEVHPWEQFRTKKQGETKESERRKEIL